MAFDIKWDVVGERKYQSGVDRGVLYLKDGSAAPWNGLVSIEDNTEEELKSYYLDGVKILDHVVPGDYAGKLTAFTYPEEFERVLGEAPGGVLFGMGVHFHEQESQSFNLSYRTKIGNDLDENAGYVIHLLYNLRAISDSKSFQTLGDQAEAEQFSWTLSGTPPIGTIDGIRPTCHISVDSINCNPETLQLLENILYGTDTNGARFPTVLEIRVLFGEVGGFYVIDNGDGTWTGIDSSNDFITSIVDDIFTIDHVDATYIIPDDTYEVSDTPIPLP